ncbi:Uncharacterised protein [uncultured archaeon]|nr:Uncharacterised protein [uncultured archaeon]
MNFWNFLSKLLPDSIVKIIQKNDNRKIEINGDVIIIGNQKIEDTKQVDEFYAALSKVAQQDTLPFQLLHKDIAEEYLTYEDISIRESANLHLLKEVLPSEDMECILMARRVLLAYDKKDKETGNVLMTQLERNFPQKGRKVFNLVSVGYFDEMVLPFIEIFKAQHGIKNYVQEFRKFYADILHFFPIAVFVGNRMTEDGVKVELERRLHFKDVPFIRLHAIGTQNIEKVENAIKTSGIEKTHTTSRATFTSPSGLQALTLEIKMPETKKE